MRKSPKYLLNIVSNYKSDTARFSRRKSFPLVTRLFFSHLIVMSVAITILVVVRKTASPIMFARQIQKIEAKRAKDEIIDFQDVRAEIEEGFEITLNQSTILSAIFGMTVAGGLSFLVAQRITQQMFKIERVTQQFARGKFSERLPHNDIPELDRLSTNFNNMASSLEGVEQRRRELVTDLTHELRTPLTIINGYLEGITSSNIEATPDVYARLMKETRRLQRLVNDLQELSKAEAGYLSINLVPTNLYPLLSALIERFKAQLLDEITIHLEYSKNLPLILADIDRLEQILVNLLGNAVSYTRKGSITLRAWQQADRVFLAVTDTGHGIAAEDLPHVFERFWRSSLSKERNNRGSGIGLAISRRLVELQGGQIEVESELGKGSTFRFSLAVA
jgi:signal transduction histidine kinase